jgi:hypothetical protein
VTRALFDEGLQRKSDIEYHLGANIATVVDAIPS